MARKPEAKAVEGQRKSGRSPEKAAQTITVLDGNNTPTEKLMKLPKAQIVREMSIPENRTRFLVDVNNKTKKGKAIIALMESLRDGDATAIKKVTENLEALAGTVAKKSAPKK